MCEVHVHFMLRFQNNTHSFHPILAKLRGNYGNQWGNYPVIPCRPANYETAMALFNVYGILSHFIVM